MARAAHPVDVNDQVELEVLDGPAAGRYTTRVELVSKKRLGLAAPKVKGAVLTIPVGTEVVLHALRIDPVRGGRYRARAQAVANVVLDEQVPVILVEVHEWERIQLRSFIRAPAIVPVRFRRLQQGQHKGRWEHAETRDVGGGGLLLWVREPLEPGAQVELAIELPDRVVSATGEVVRQMPPDEPSGRGVGIAVRFLAIADADRDRIIGFVLRRQAEIRRMEIR